MVISGLKKHTGAPFSVLLSGMFPAYYKMKNYLDSAVIYMFWVWVEWK